MSVSILMDTLLFMVHIVPSKGVTGGPSGPSRKGPGIGHKIEERESNKWTERNGKRYRNALRHGQRQKY